MIGGRLGERGAVPDARGRFSTTLRCGNRWLRPLAIGLAFLASPPLALAARHPVVHPRAPIIAASEGRTILVASPRGHRLALTRFDENGRPDSSFGNAGLRRLPFHKSNAWVTGLAIRSNGSIDVVVSHAGCNACGVRVVVLQLKPNGSSDPAFGGNGQARALRLSALGSSGQPALDQQGDLFVPGYGFTACPGVCDPDQYVAKLLPNGQLDPSFGSSGIASHFGTNSPPGAQAVAGVSTVAVDPSGTIVAGGIARNPVLGGSIVLRFTAGGLPDPSFGSDGTVRTNTPVRALYPTADGKLVVGGAGGECCGELQGEVFGLQRLLADGTEDPTFAAGNGSIAITIGADTSARGQLIKVPGGRFVIAGETFGACQPPGLQGDGNCVPRVSLVRFHSDGKLDRDFGSKGRVTMRLSSQRQHTVVFEAVDAVVAHRRIYAAASPMAESNSSATVLAFHLDGPPVRAFGNGGRLEVPR